MCDLDELADSEASESVVDTESVKRILESSLRGVTGFGYQFKMEVLKE